MLLQWDKPDDVAEVENYNLYLLNGCDVQNYSDSNWLSDFEKNTVRRESFVVALEAKRVDGRQSLLSLGHMQAIIDFEHWLYHEL